MLVDIVISLSKPAQSGAYAVYGALIGFSGAVLGFTVKEIFDRRRQWRSTLNNLRLLCDWLESNLKTSPSDKWNLPRDRLVSLVGEIGSNSELVRAFILFDGAAQIAQSEWAKSGVVPPAAIDDIRTRLGSAREILLSHSTEGVVSRVLDRLAGIRTVRDGILPSKIT